MVAARQKELRKEATEFGMFFATALEAGGDVYGALKLSAEKFGGEQCFTELYLQNEERLARLREARYLEK